MLWKFLVRHLLLHCSWSSQFCPIKFEIEQRQLFFLKRILDKDPDDPVHDVYKEQLNYNFEQNWANHISQLRRTYNFPLSDENIKRMTLSQWKSVVKSAIRQDAFMQLTIQCANNKKTSHLKYESFVRSSYLKKLDPNIARVIFKARTRMFDIKSITKENINLILTALSVNTMMRRLIISSNVTQAYFDLVVFMQQN